MTTLVTGGNGWLPSHVVRRLARAGETVVIYDVMEPDGYLRAFLGADISNVVLEPGDVTDRERLREAATRHGVTSMISADSRSTAALQRRTATGTVTARTTCGRYRAK